MPMLLFSMNVGNHVSLYCELDIPKVLRNTDVVSISKRIMIRIDKSFNFN